ncbi:cistern family PEP-CTERM protein [Sandarakinorhabdus sp. AAP62]|uniref:cistern family PEP-CTERM protein n=1 Tax=Sandarakinorhabdus sp. AAP62 TaxID=1248916 RepID=UPI0006861D5E|nr:cistern family PEP-CTERM protein [Sandarakinorhabdus sp. AAP62]
MAFSAIPAAAVDLVDSPVTVNSGDIGSSFTYNFNGIVGETFVDGLTAAITFTLTGVSANVWTFSADFDNAQSTAPVGGRISGFGFNGNPEITGATPLSGPFTGALLNAGFPQLGGGTTIDFCLTANNNCQGGGGGGVADGASATQTFSLSFANPITSVTFNNFIIRYQSVTGTTLGTSGIGLGGNGFIPGGGAVPEPATWAMLLTGFGLVGFAARRRRGALSVAA